MKATVYFFCLVLFLVSCKKSRVDESVYVSDPNFESIITPVNVLKENMQEFTCFYENNAVKLFVDPMEGEKIEWFYKSADEFVTMGNGRAVEVRFSGVFKLKHHYVDGLHPVDTVVDFSLDYCPTSIEFPEAFSPNGDGQFDTYRPIFQGVKTYAFQVSNRERVVVFETNEVSNGSWNGQYIGSDVPIGTYSYRCTGTLLNGYKFEKYGEFQLVR